MPSGEHKTCSICRNASLCETVNEMLAQKAKLDDIAAVGGFSRTAVWRHRWGAKCYLKWKAEKEAAKKAARGLGPATGRTLVYWPPGWGPAGSRDLREGPLYRLMDDGSQFDIADRQRTDIMFKINFEETPLEKIRNPDALVTDELIEAALAEDVLRSS